MGHIVVTRVVLGLCGVLLAAAALFAWRVTPPAPPAASPAAAEPDAFREHCAACHDAADLAAGLRAAPDRGTAVREMRAFLDDHGGASAGQNDAIVTWLDELARAR